MLKLTRMLGDVAAVGNAQLCVLNPLVRERLGGLASRFLLPVQTSSERRLLMPGLGARGVGGVSSFGYSGTIAHAVVRRGEAVGGGRGVSTSSPLVYRRRAFAWRRAFIG